MLRAICVTQSAVRAVAEPGASRGGFPTTKCSFLATESRRLANAVPRYDIAGPNAMGWRSTCGAIRALLRCQGASTASSAGAAGAFFVRIGATLADFIGIDTFRTGTFDVSAFGICATGSVRVASGIRTAFRFAANGWFLAAARNIVGASLFENFSGALNLPSRTTMHGEQDSAALHAAFVFFRFEFRHAHADEGAGEAADHAACADSCKRGDERASSEQRADSRNGQRADSSEHAQCAANHCASACARGSAFRGFRVFYGANFRDAVAAQRRGIFVRVGVTWLVNARRGGRFDE